MGSEDCAFRKQMTGNWPERPRNGLLICCAGDEVVRAARRLPHPRAGRIAANSPSRDAAPEHRAMGCSRHRAKPPIMSDVRRSAGKENGISG